MKETVMSEAMNERESVQTQTTNLSEKVTPPLLDRMYNNFVKITDWVVKGKESKYPLPKALAGLFDATEQNTNEVAELKQLVTTLQNNLIDKEQRITALDGALQSVNATLANFINVMNSQAVTGVTPQTQNPVAPEPVVATPATQPAPVEVVDELVDLDDVTDVQDGKAGAKPAEVSPNEQAIQASAEAVGAGNIDPASYQALDAEIGALLG